MSERRDIHASLRDQRFSKTSRLSSSHNSPGRMLQALASALVVRALLHPLKRESRAKWLKVALHKKPSITTPVVRGSRPRRVGDDILRSPGWYRLWEQLRAARRAAR